MRCLWLSFSRPHQTKREKAIHLGGALQLLFGIKGKRWTNPTYGMKSLPFITENYYNNLMNEFWTSPAKQKSLLTPTMWKELVIGK